MEARHVRLRNSIKSALAHDAVTGVVLHKHHLIIRVGAGLIQFVYGSHSRLAADLTRDKKLFSLPFSRGFFCCLVQTTRVSSKKNRRAILKCDNQILEQQNCLY